MSSPIGRDGRDHAEYEKYFYPGPEPRTLINKLNIQDRAELEKAERDFTDRRAKQGLPDHATPKTYDGFKAIHRHLFQDLYDWAGQERTYTTGRGAAPFAIPEHIPKWMEGQFSALRAKNFLIGADPKAFAARAAEFVNEINAGHPFLDGNGRTQRFWLRALAAQAGYSLRITSADRTQWNEASRLGFQASNHAPMTELIGKRLQRTQSDTQNEGLKDLRERYKAQGDRKPAGQKNGNGQSQ